MKLALRVLTAAALVGVAVVHLRHAGSYSSVGKDPLSLADQFRVQAVLALLLTLAVLVRPVTLVWAACVAFSVGSLAVLVYSRYRALPVYGFSGGFQETWAAPGAKLAAVLEGVATAASVTGLIARRRVSAG